MALINYHNIRDYPFVNFMTQKRYAINSPVKDKKKAHHSG